MSVFVVQLASVYLHGVIGVFSSEEQARAGIAEVHQSSDGFHVYEITEYELDTPLVLSRLKAWRSSPTTDEPKIVTTSPQLLEDDEYE